MVVFLGLGIREVAGKCCHLGGLHGLEIATRGSGRPARSGSTRSGLLFSSYESVFLGATNGTSGYLRVSAIFRCNRVGSLRSGLLLAFDAVRLSHFVYIVATKLIKTSRYYLSRGIHIKMAYHAHQIHLTMDQAQKLARGLKVRVRSGGEHAVHLTATQLARMQKAHSAQKACGLHMSMAQLRHHSKHGKGFFSDLVGSIKPWAVGALKNVAEPLVGLATDKLNEATGNHLPTAITDLVKNGLTGSVKGLIDRVGGELGPHVHAHLMKHIMGGSLFSDILGGVSSVLTSPVGQLGLKLAMSGAGIRSGHGKRAAHHWKLMVKHIGKNFGHHVAAYIHGSGLFDDILGGINSVLTSPLGQLGQNLLASKMGSGIGSGRPARSKKARSGGSFM